MDHETWRRRRIEALTAADGFLTLAGLFWLEPGRHRLGSAAGNDLVLPVGPAHWGTLELGDAIRWEAPGQPLQVLASDRQGEATPVRAGAVSFILIERDGRLALRLRDNDAPARRDFAGIASFDFDPAWAVAARWEADPREITVATMTGGLETRTVPGRALFERDGRSASLTPVDADDSGLFFVFADATSGKKDGNGTYGAGRFLRAHLPENGLLTLDFNRAYNPPCVFTPHAACPLAPPENRLPFPVTAGEKYPP